MFRLQYFYKLVKKEKTPRQNSDKPLERKNKDSSINNGIEFIL